MKATKVLMAEHEGIMEMLRITWIAAERLKAEEKVDIDIFRNAVDFFANFADRCHHGKEEHHLFTRMAEKGIPEKGGPIGVMLLEHEAGRSHIRGMKAALESLASGSESAEGDLAHHALAYVQLLSDHIQKENGVLFPMADRVLNEQEQDDLAAAFEAVEAQEIGEGVHERYHRMIHALREQIG